VDTVGTRWYTLAEAAPVLGVSVDTVRRRLKRGQIEGRQVHTQHGPTWEVSLGDVSTERQEAAEGAAQGAQGGTEGDAGRGIAQLIALVDRLQQENRVLAGQVGFLTAQLSMAEERLALAAPVVPQAQQDANLHDGVQIVPTDAPVLLLARLQALAPLVLAVLAIVAVIVLLVWLR
jgi:hypothetical protein